MPIKTQSDLPAKEILINENIFVMDESRAMHQDIRPLEVLILNNMPVKQDTELQILRALSNTPLQVDVTFLNVKSHVSLNTSASHLNKFYTTLDEIRDKDYDGMIVTGAPVEELPFEEVDYWQEICEIFDWAQTHVTSTLHICWAAQAGFYHYYGIDKKLLPQKLFGVYEHKVENRKIPLVRGSMMFSWPPEPPHSYAFGGNPCLQGADHTGGIPGGRRVPCHGRGGEEDIRHRASGVRSIFPEQ